MTFCCSNPLLWALKLIFFLVACKDLKRAPCSLSQEGSYLCSGVGRGLGKRLSPVWGRGRSPPSTPAPGASAGSPQPCLSVLVCGSWGGSAGSDQGSFCTGFLTKLDFDRGEPVAPSSFSGVASWKFCICVLEINSAY